LPNVIKAGRVIFSGEAPVFAPTEISVPEAQKNGNSARGGHGNETMERIRERSLEEVQDEAEMTLLAAKNEAQILLDKTKVEAEELKRLAAEDGRKQGYEAGWSEGAEKAESLKEEAQRILVEAKAQSKWILQGLEGQVVEFIIKIAEKLIGGASRLNPEVIAHLMRQGLEEAPRKGGIAIRVNPDDYAAASEALSEIPGASGATLVKDQTIENKGCIIDTPIGSIDCSLDKQFQALKEDIMLLYEMRSE
jgi:flagellar assembly protein FliH